MRRWFFDVNYHRHDKAKRRLRRSSKLFLFIVILAAAALAFDVFYLSNNTDPSRPSNPREYRYEIPTKVFKTEFFEMETPESWEFQEKLSDSNRFVYYNIRNKLARGMLYVYVNKKPVPAHEQATRLLPVKVDVNRFLVPESTATDHCNKTAPSKDRVGEEQIKLRNIYFTCDNDSTLYTVLLAMEGGTPQMNLSRPGGSKATYNIYYQDSTANPASADLVEVIRKFQIK